VAELTSIACTVPAHEVTQEDTRRLLPVLTAGEHQAARVRRLLPRTRIARRYVGLPIDELTQLREVSDRAAHYQRLGLELGERAAREALAGAGLGVEQVAGIVSVSSTAYTVPSVEARLVERLGLAPGVRRWPITELGCSAGVAGLGLARTLVAGGGGEGAIVLLSVELCSLSIRTHEQSDSDAIGNLLFGDAAAAAVVSNGTSGAGPELLAAGTAIWPGTTGLLGMQITNEGFRLVLSSKLPGKVKAELPGSIDQFLAAQGVRRSDIAFWAIHPGGPKVLGAIEESLALDEAATEPTWETWEQFGNVSSATVFLVLETLRRAHPPAPGSLGLMLAFGPGVSCEMVLLRAGGWLSARNASAQGSGQRSGQRSGSGTTRA
jgi:alkylresorcinol/alkylpyrone synthase